MTSIIMIQFPRGSRVDFCSATEVKRYLNNIKIPHFFSKKRLVAYDRKVAYEKLLFVYRMIDKMEGKIICKETFITASQLRYTIEFPSKEQGEIFENKIQKVDPKILYKEPE